MRRLVTAVRLRLRPALSRLAKPGSCAIDFRFSAFSFRSLTVATVLLVVFTGSFAFPAQSSSRTPSLTFTKVMKGSSPEYLVLHVDEHGDATYDSHKLGDPPAPRSFQISAVTTARIFSLTQTLSYFRNVKLDSRHKVANLGLKTLQYQDGQGTSEVQFNYSDNRSAQQLTDILERISNVEERITQLEYAMKYDPLSLSQILLQIEADFGDGLFAEAALFDPTLEKILSDSRYLHLAQVRAREIEALIHKKH